MALRPRAGYADRPLDRRRLARARVAPRVDLRWTTAAEPDVLVPAHQRAHEPHAVPRPTFPAERRASSLHLLFLRRRILEQQLTLSLSCAQGLFAHHQQVQDYLEDFSDPLRPYIRFNTRVTTVRHTLPSDPPPPSSGSRRWFASFRSTLEDDDAVYETEHFDAVFVANGHYSRPYLPWIDGLRSFSGEISHARWYRDAEQFKDKVRLSSLSSLSSTAGELVPRANCRLTPLVLPQTVLVIGNSASGYDITRELASSIHSRRLADPDAASALPKIYQSARSPAALGIPWNAPDAPEYSNEVREVPPIRRVEGRRIEFENGQVVEDVDTMCVRSSSRRARAPQVLKLTHLPPCSMFATGYYFSFPFLSPSHEPFKSHPVTYSPLQTGERGAPSGAEGGIRMHGLDDRFLFLLADPTMAFLALPYLVRPLLLLLLALLARALTPLSLPHSLSPARRPSPSPSPRPKPASRRSISPARRSSRARSPSRPTRRAPTRARVASPSRGPSRAGGSTTSWIGS